MRSIPFISFAQQEAHADMRRDTEGRFVSAINVKRDQAILTALFADLDEVRTETARHIRQLEDMLLAPRQPDTYHPYPGNREPRYYAIREAERTVASLQKYYERLAALDQIRDKTLQQFRKLTQKLRRAVKEINAN